jgi:hypothetical protein
MAFGCYNVSDDWGSYYSRCPNCGERYHASEGCACVACEWCGDCYHENSYTVEFICNKCLSCDHCGEVEEENYRYFIIDLANEDFDPDNPPTRSNGDPECEMICKSCVEKLKKGEYKDFVFVRVSEEG